MHLGVASRDKHVKSPWTLSGLRIDWDRLRTREEYPRRMVGTGRSGCWCHDGALVLLQDKEKWWLISLKSSGTGHVTLCSAICFLPCVSFPSQLEPVDRHRLLFSTFQRLATCWSGLRDTLVISTNILIPATSRKLEKRIRTSSSLGAALRIVRLLLDTS
jgi:hypothetical protein